MNAWKCVSVEIFNLVFDMILTDHTISIGTNNDLQ
jgi:hypothetical protein